MVSSHSRVCTEARWQWFVAEIPWIIGKDAVLHLPRVSASLCAFCVEYPARAEVVQGRRSRQCTIRISCCNSLPLYLTELGIYVVANHSYFNNMVTRLLNVLNVLLYITLQYLPTVFLQRNLLSQDISIPLVGATGRILTIIDLFLTISLSN